MVPFPPSDAAAPRDPQLSAAHLRRALAGLDAKIRTLHHRAHATAAGSANTYATHAATLEAKRTRLAAQLAPPPGSGQERQPDIETLRPDV